MDMALEATNQRGRYQIYLIIIVVFLPFTTFVISAGYPYLTSIPILYCQDKHNNDITTGYTKCDMTSYCSNPSNYNIQIDTAHSIDSLAMKYNLYCSRSFYSPLINSFFFAGAIVGVAICANYPDRIGRLPVLKLLMIINIFAQINYFFNISIQHILLVAFLSGFATYCNSVLSLLIIETMDSTWSGIVMSARSASYGLVGISLSFYFMIVNNLSLLLFINIAISIGAYMLASRNFVESARWLNSKNRVFDAIKSLKHMAEINGSRTQFQTFLDVNMEMLEASHKEIEEIKTNYNIIQIFQLKSQRRLICMLLYIWFFITVCFYGIFTSLNKSSGNIFIKSIVTYTGEVIAEMSSGILANKYGRVIVTETLSYIGGIAFICSYFISDDFASMKSIVLFISSFGFAGAMNLLYIYTNEIFPLSIKALTFGMMYLCSRAGGVFVPLFLSSNYYPIIMGLLSISCGYLMGKLDETLGRKLEDDVPEAIRHYSILSTAPVNKELLQLVRLSFNLGKDGINHEHFKLSFEEVKPIALSDKF